MLIDRQKALAQFESRVLSYRQHSTGMDLVCAPRLRRIGDISYLGFYFVLSGQFVVALDDFFYKTSD